MAWRPASSRAFLFSRRRSFLPWLLLSLSAGLIALGPRGTGFGHGLAGLCPFCAPWAGFAVGWGLPCACHAIKAAKAAAMLASIPARETRLKIELMPSCDFLELSLATHEDFVWGDLFPGPSPPWEVVGGEVLWTPSPPARKFLGWLFFNLSLSLSKFRKLVTKLDPTFVLAPNFAYLHHPRSIRPKTPNLLWCVLYPQRV